MNSKLPKITLRREQDRTLRLCSRVQEIIMIRTLFNISTISNLITLKNCLKTKTTMKEAIMPGDNLRCLNEDHLEVHANLEEILKTQTKSKLRFIFNKNILECKIKISRSLNPCYCREFMVSNPKDPSETLTVRKRTTNPTIPKNNSSNMRTTTMMMIAKCKT